MKLFNRKKGSGSFVFNVGVHHFELKPQQWSAEIPDDYAKTLLEKYPKELTSDAPSSAAVDKRVAAAVKDAHKDKDAEIALLKEQLRKAQALALAVPAGAEPEKGKPGRPKGSGKSADTAPAE